MSQMDESLREREFELREAFVRTLGQNNPKQIALDISDYMSRGPVTVRAESSVEQAFLLMGQHGVQHLPVLQGNEVIGVISNEDIARAWSEHSGRAPHVEWAMNRNPLIVTPDTSIIEVLKEMQSRAQSCALVRRPGEPLCGIFTVRDALGLLTEAFEGYRKAGNS